MKPLKFLSAGLVLAAVVPALPAARPVADVLAPEQRRAVLDKAARYARPAEAAPVAPDLVTPFDPAGFEKPDASEARQARNENRGAAPGAAAEAKPDQPPVPATDQELLATVAGRIPTTGTIILGGRPLLISGTNRIEVGSRFTVVYNGQEYELELVAIDRTTFTVRYKTEEFTRPIKLGRTP